MHHVVKHDPANVQDHWDATTARAINGLRVLAADMVQEANSGHPGAPMGMAPMAYVLYSRFMRHDPAHPHWINRDRFVLSNGHACALLYSVLHLSGYHFTLDDLKAFRKVASKTPGHPETGPDPKFDGVEVTTGPLGQGLSNAVGIALAERHMAATFNQPGFELFDNYTYVFCGDGCLQEGITSEASSVAGHLGLGKLIVMYDSNQITIDGETELAFTEDVGARYRAYGWHVQEVQHGNGDLEGLARAIEQARAEREKPSMIICKTTIGFGAAKQGTEAVHGSPLGAEDLANVKKLFGFDPAAKFAVPQECYDAFDARKKGAAAYAQWEKLFADYDKAFPAQAAELSRRMAKQLPKDWLAGLPKYTPEGKPEATRVSGGLVLNALAAKMPEIVGGSADLNPSTMTYLKASQDFQKGSPAGRNIRFGVREHAMAAISNGIAAYGALVPFCSTFLNFLGYAVIAKRAFLVAILNPSFPAAGLLHTVGHLAPGRALYFYARLDRTGRGRPHAPARGKVCAVPLDAQHALPAPGRRQRDGGGLYPGPGAPLQAGRLCALAPGRAAAGGLQPRKGCLWCVRAAGGGAPAPRARGHRLRGVAVRAGARRTAQEASRGLGGLLPVLGAV